MMSRLAFQLTAFVLLVVAVLTASAARADESSNKRIEFVHGNGQINVTIDGLQVATYYYDDHQISRPFFAHVRVPSGVQITRHHPPVEGQDLSDHGTFHPGIWMAFGDISSSDYWRLKATVRHTEFVEKPKAGEGRGRFAVRNQYLDQREPIKVVCEEVARYTVVVRAAGYLLLWDSTFSSDSEFHFGDQQEMGLGIRVATPLRVGASGSQSVPRGHGTILDSEGRKNGDEVAGNTADWCDYSGAMEGRHVGMTVFCHPENFRPSRFHARDYGLLVANPFGRKAFGKGGASKVVIKPGEKLRLRYGVLLHSAPEATETDLKAMYQEYVRLAE